MVVRVRILAVGRLKNGPERELAARYLDRAAVAGSQMGLTGFNVDEIAEAREHNADQRRNQEASRLLARLGPGCQRIVLDDRGRAMSSNEFAALLGQWRDGSTAEAAFLIGGPDGHGAAALQDANLTLGFGTMTWPHQLVRVMLAEQLYRAITILSGHPYHRA
jgi:23S rRNA (pseudouridine1915-N3)-methyltransferase